MERSSDTLILGVGNYLMGDEGLGVHLAQELKDEILPGLADVLDGGTAGFQLMEYIESYPRVILIDATLDDKPAGTIQLIRPKFASDFPKAMSTHEIGLKDLVESLTLLDQLPDVYLFVVSVKTIQPLSVDLSPDVQVVFPELKKRILELCLRPVEVN
ncbi:MAG: hydrogenase maturation protease [Cyclobacteriaceae bacterium]|nr:hydrogenase maturation protease [Cyclobacteriaceae bacterium]UYN86854.1 MAG: hydrogenase maturation protease [Cyclobacteriaceae bacterium]